MFLSEKQPWNESQLKSYQKNSQNEADILEEGRNAKAPK